MLRIADDLLDAPLFSTLIKEFVLLQRMSFRSALVPKARHAIDAALGDSSHRAPSDGALPAGIG